MPNFAVFLQGEYFDIHYKGKSQSVGFFTTVRVEADTENEASGMAMKAIKSDPRLAEAFRPEASTQPDLQVKAVHELESGNKMKNTKYTFFTMDEV